MQIHPKIKPVIYASIVFIVFMSLSALLKYFTHRATVEDVYFNTFSNKDLLIGAGLAVFLTFTHEQKKKLK